MQTQYTGNIRFSSYLETNGLNFNDYQITSDNEREKLHIGFEKWLKKHPISEKLTKEQLEVLQNFYGIENFKDKTWRTISFKQQTVLESYNLAPDPKIIPYKPDDTVFFIINKKELNLSLLPHEMVAFAMVLEKYPDTKNYAESKEILEKMAKSKISDYANDKIDISINNVEAMKNLIFYIKDTDISLDRAIANTKLDKVIQEFEERHGLIDFIEGSEEKINIYEKTKVNYGTLSQLANVNYFTQSKELKDMYKLLTNIKVKDEKQELFGWKENIKQKIKKDGKLIKDSEIDLFIKSINQKTINQLIGSKTYLSKDNFSDAFLINMQTALIEISTTDQIGKFQFGENDFANNTKRVIKALEGKKNLSIDQNTFISYLTYQNKENEDFAKYLGGKIGNKIAASNIKTKVKNNDETLTKKYSQRYLKTRKFLYEAVEIAAWMGAAGLVGLNPIGITALAAASAVRQIYKIRKEYLIEKDEAKKKGKNKKFTTYIKENRLKCILAGVTAASAAIPIIATSLPQVEKIQSLASVALKAVQSTKFFVAATIIGRTIVPMVIQTIKKPNIKNIKRVVGTVVVAYGAYKAGEAINEAFNGNSAASAVPFEKPQTLKELIKPENPSVIKYYHGLKSVIDTTLEEIDEITGIEQAKVNVAKEIAHKHSLAVRGIDDISDLKSRTFINDRYMPRTNLVADLKDAAKAVNTAIAKANIQIR